jgi:CRP-like cAMP-binding protein
MKGENLERLADCSDLRYLPESALERLASHANSITKGRGELIWRTRDAVREVFVLLEGVAHVQMSGPDGDLILTGLLVPGHLFGEAEIFADESVRFNQVMAAEKCRLMVLPEALFREAVDQNPQYALYWLRKSSQKFVVSLKHIYSLKVGSARARLARTLILINDWQSASGRNEMALSQEAIGQYAGLSRQVVNQILSRWKKEGVISTGYGYVRLVDRVLLEELADKS